MIALLGGCRRDNQIQNYQTPKEQEPPPPAAPAMPMMGADSLPVPANSAPPHWSTPAAWQEIPPNGVRLGDFVVPGTQRQKSRSDRHLPPRRRRRRAGQRQPLAAGGRPGRHYGNELASDKIAVDSCEGKLYDLAGAANTRLSP